MEDDGRYQWLEKRIMASLNPKREAMSNLIGNEDNKLVILEFLNNEDVKQIYIYLKSLTQLIASRNCSTDNSYDKGIFFLKISNSSKLTAEKMNDQVAFFEASFRIFDHMDLMTREVFMPLLCADLTSSDQSDKLMDIMHRIITQIAVAQSQIEDSVTLPLPALGVLASAANNPTRRLTVLHILETTIINWQKQIKNVLKQQPEAVMGLSTFFTKDEIHVWTTCINKLNNLIVQLDAPHVKDILSNLENNNSVYIQSFGGIKNDIRQSINGAEINLRYISTLTSWIHRIKSPNLLENAQYLFSGLFHTVLLIWKHSKYYHSKQRFAHLLLFLSNEIVAVSHEKVGSNVLQEPLTSYDKLKEALRICAMFRGTYLDFKEKADTLNSKYHKLDKKIDFNERLIWWIQSNVDRSHENDYDEFEVLRQTSPWPKRNHACFLHLNVFMERCNDALELVQTMRHFQIFAKTVSIGGADNKNMDLLAQEIHAKYAKAINEFQRNVTDVMNFDDESQNFEISFFNLRTTIKELERELSQILNLSIQNCTTINSKLRLLEVFEGVHERDVIQSQLQTECSWLMNELLKEFDNVRVLANSSQTVASILPTVVTKLFWLNGLEQRIRVPMEKFSYLYPNLLQGDLGYKLREIYKQTCDHLEKIKRDTLKKWESKIAPNLTDKLQETVLKNVTSEDSKRPTTIEVNLSFELEKLLKEVHYLKADPLRIDLTNILKDKFNHLKDENLLRLYATRVHSICDKYNLIMKNIQPEELALFEVKLNKIDAVIEMGLNEYTWNSVEIPDYIEKAHSVICTDVFQNLELTQSNVKEIQMIVTSWCDAESDVFNGRDKQVSFTAKSLEEKQAEYHSNIKKLIIRGGSKIHSLILSTFKAVEISEASPGWQEYINYANEIIFNGFKSSSLSSLEHMYASMSDPAELENPFVSIDLELVDGELHFNPPLDEGSHIKNLQEILFDFINTFISRGSYMQVIGKNRNNYDQIVARDETIFQIVSKINVSIEETIVDCKKTLEYFNAYNYLWTSDIHATFEEFLKGNALMSKTNQIRPPSKNKSTKAVTKSIASLGSVLSPEVISNIERAFLSPYYQNISKFEKQNSVLPLLSDFDAEIAVYVNAREKIKQLKSSQNVYWIKVNLEPTIDVLITLTNKLIWKFTSFLSCQINKTLNELDLFLKRMEPDIEDVTGEERDTNTFMKIMRMFNEVSSKQQEMEVKFELIKRTLKLLKKYERFDVSELEAKFNSTPVRWTNLKSKVTLAKQRLGPTIQEESKIIIQDLKKFAIIINNLSQDLMGSFLFDRECQHEKAFSLIEEFVTRFENLQNEAADLKQLQELLDSDVVDFNLLAQSKTTLNYLKKTWKTTEEIRTKHNEWKSIRWQRVNIKSANEETDKQLELLNNLPDDTSTWDIVLGTQYEITNIKMCLPICEEIANPAMRTRHWKQLVRVSGSTALVDNETLKMLTFGQLLDLNLHSHSDEVKLIVQKAVKDLSIEQTLRTYEEIWLSKTFKLAVYENLKIENLNHSQANEDETKSVGQSSERRDSKDQGRRNSKPGGSSSRQNAKRLSIGSLPMSLIGLDTGSDNDPVHLVMDMPGLFAELDHHQNVLGDLMLNQSAGSFYDEIIKWSNTLQNIEAVMRIWNVVQIKWKRLEPIYTNSEIFSLAPTDATNFLKTDKDFKNLMKATCKNNNILKCCQRKNILALLKHLNQTLDKCYESLMQVLSEKRQKCPRFYLLNDEDLIEVICCGSNLSNLSKNIGLVFNHLESLAIDSSTNDVKVVGCFGKNKEYFPLEMPIIFKGSIDELINSLQVSIPDSLRYLLELALAGKPPPFQTFINLEEEKPGSKPLGVHIHQDNRPLPAISESFEAQPPSLFTWTFQHTSQIVELALKILFTKQIEASLKSVEDMKMAEQKFNYLINLYQSELCILKFTNNNTNQDREPTATLIINSQQRDKIKMIIKLLIYYRTVLNELIDKQCKENSPEWLVKVRYYAVRTENDFNVVIKTDSSEINYGFHYQSFNETEDVFALNYSPDIERTISSLIDLVARKSSPLVHGSYSHDLLKSIGRLLGYENNFLLCSEQTTDEILSNICHSMVISGSWLTFLSIHNLPSRQMACLSSVLSQISEEKETITIHNMQVTVEEKPKQLFAYFATTQPTNEIVKNSHVDSLKITKIDHCLSKICKELLDKFRVIYFQFTDLKSIISSNLIVNGYTSVEVLTNDIMKLVDIYNLVLKTILHRNDHTQDKLNPGLINYFIKQASNLMHDRDFNKSMQQDDLALYEKNSIGVAFSNALFPRLDAKSKILLMNYLKTAWKHVKLPLRHQLAITNNKTFQNLPIKIEKETAMQIEDKTVLNNINDAVAVSTSKLKLSSSVLFQSRCVNLIENLSTHRNLLIVGKSGFGKTTLLKTALTALSELGYSNKYDQIYINGYNESELFGKLDPKSGSLKEGLIAHSLRRFDEETSYNILNIVGESMLNCFYLYDSLFCDEPIFLNQNNEKIITKNMNLNLIWETDDISNLTPSVLSSSNLIFLSTPLTIWQHYVEATFLSFKGYSKPAYKKLQNDLICKLAQVKAEFDSKPFRYVDVLPVMFESKVRLVLSILKSILKLNDDSKWDESDTLSMVEYCVSSGVSASMNEKSREVFNSWMQTVLKTYPADGTIYDYFYDIDSHQFIFWSDIIPTFSCPIHQGIPLNVFVHTPSTMFLNSMVDVMMNLDESIMIAGETGCGKTSLITDKLKASCSGDLTELFYITINTNRLTNSSYLYNRINHHLSWLHGSYYLPKGNKKMYCFIDDINQAEIDEFNRQSALEFLRQHLDSGKFYDFSAKKSQIVKNVTYVSTYNYKYFSPSSSVSNKILKHFHVIAQHFPSNSETHGIYTKLLYRHLIGDIENESGNAKQNVTILNRLRNLQDILKNIVQSSIDLNQKMRSIYLEKHQRLHYIFSLRIVTSLFRHMCISLSPDCTKEQILLLWHHECDWLYGARMIDSVDVERYELAYKTVAKMNFNDNDQLSMLRRHVYFTNLKETESGIVIAGVNGNSNGNINQSFVSDGYVSMTDIEQIRKLVQTALNEYNKEQQRITLPLYETTLTLISRLCHTMQSVGGNCCIVADGGISPFVLQLVASLMQFTLINFKTTQFVYNKNIFFQQLKHKLVQSLYKAGIKGEKVMLCLTEEEMVHKEFLAYITEFITSEEVMHLFTIEEETTILNSIRTQVVQAGFMYSKETAWEFFIKNIRENTRVVLFMNENASRFQSLGVEYPSLFHNMELIWVQHLCMRELVDNASYHLADINWLDDTQKENLAHLLASMHSSIKESDETHSAHLNNLTYTKFTEKFKELLLMKYKEIEVSHKNVCRLLEHIQRQHSTAKKLLVQLQQENMVLEERIQSTDKMLQQIGQDMTMTEQQLKVHNMQTKKTVQLKRILPEYQSAHERNVYKTVAIVANTKKLIHNINMNSLQELRSVSKPSTRVEDILASVIIILKSPTADVTWQKGAKRQMANLDRFLDELQTFDEHEIAENTIKLLEDLDKKIISTEVKEEETNSLYASALNTLHQWTKGVLKYHSLMIHHVRPLHAKCVEIEKEVKEADQKLTSLDRKSDALNNRLKDLAENFEEATVDKEEQQEKVAKMKQQLQTASELNIILSREFDRNMQVYESVQERIFCLPAACALAAGFLVYLGPYQFPFRRIMLTNNWIKCLNDRGLPLVLDSLNLIKGRVVKWQMDSMAHLLSNSNIITIPGEDWKVHFASDQIDNQLFMGNATQSDLLLESSKVDSKMNLKDSKPVLIVDEYTGSQEKIVKINEPEVVNKKASPEVIEKVATPVQEVKKDQENIKSESELLDVTSDSQTIQTNQNNGNDHDTTSNEENTNVNETKNNESMFYEESLLKIDGQALSQMSRLSEQTDTSEYFVNASSYKNFLISLIQFIIGEEECNEWMSKDATGLELENATIVKFSERHPPLIYDPFAVGTQWIIDKITQTKIDLEYRNPEDLLAIEKSFQSGTKVLYTNCNDIDSSILPLIHYKNSMTQSPIIDESRLVLFSMRRLFCNPAFQMFFTTSQPLDQFTPNTLACTTPISYGPSIENFVDQFQLILFRSMFPDEYKKRNLLMQTIKDCTQKIKDIDFMLKNKWEKDGFNVDQILNTKLALQRKYKIGEVLDYCQEYLANLNDLMKILTPVAVRASLLMTLSIKVSSIIKSYKFSVSFIEHLLLDMSNMVPIDTQELELKSKLPVNRPHSSGVDLKQVEVIEAELPEVPSTEEISSNEIQLYSSENIDLLTKHLTNTYVNKIMISLLPEHRLYLLTLICFYIKLQQKQDFNDLELEFLMRSKHATNITISPVDFGISKSTQIPQWLPKDTLNDLLAMSLLQGDLDHFIVSLINAESEWKKWYNSPLVEPMPKVGIELEKSRLDWVDLNEFRQLIVHKVMRSDTYITALNNYVIKSLAVELDEPSYEHIFNSSICKSIIINMGTQSNISISSSMNRIHKNLYKIIQQNGKQEIIDLNCTFQTLSEIQTALKEVSTGFVLLRNVHLASPDVIKYAKQLCESFTDNDEIKWRLVMTKSFDFILPSVIVMNSLQVSFDVMDIMAHNSIEQNKKIHLETCQIKEETLIFNCIQNCLNLTKKDDISNLLKQLPASKNVLVYYVCFTQGLLQARQSLACNGLQKHIPWGTSCIIQCIHEIIRNDFSKNLTETFPSMLVDNVYKHFLQDKLDQDYVNQVLSNLTADNHQIHINTVLVPIPKDNILPSDYPNWLEENIPEREFNVNIIQLHEKQLIYYNTIRAENFIESLQELWETSTNRSVKLEEEIQQDWLHFAIKMCTDRLPDKLPMISDTCLEFGPENSLAFALYQEYNLFNENICLVRNHLRNLEKFILYNTHIFPAEWKTIALTLQSQRVPDEWETACCRPSIYTLKSWVKSQTIRYTQLKEIGEKGFRNISSVNAAILKHPGTLFSSILLQRSNEMKWGLDECELCFEVREDDDVLPSELKSKGALILKDLKIIGASWDPVKKSLVKSESLINKLPPIMAYANKIGKNEKNPKNQIHTYLTQLRQYYVTKIEIPNCCYMEYVPYIAFDTGDEEAQSRRLQRPIQTSVQSNLNQNAQPGTPSIELTDRTSTTSKSMQLAAAGQAIKQNLLKANNTLNQIREVSMEKFPGMESQLSFKEMSPNAPPLPPDLQTLVRSEHIDKKNA